MKPLHAFQNTAWRKNSTYRNFFSTLKHWDILNNICRLIFLYKSLKTEHAHMWFRVFFLFAKHLWWTANLLIIITFQVPVCTCCDPKTSKQTVIPSTFQNAQQVCLGISKCLHLVYQQMFRQIELVKFKPPSISKICQRVGWRYKQFNCTGWWSLGKNKLVL